MPIKKLSQHREIKSFVRRERSMAQKRKENFVRLWQKYGLSSAADFIDTKNIFQKNAPLIIEIGFGYGDALLKFAEQNSENNYLGIEVYTPGLEKLLVALEKASLDNVKVFREDAKKILAKIIPVQSIDAILLFFPDPWPKQRHHKRRLVQPAFVELIAQKLKPNGYFHFATDSEDYAKYVLKVMAGCGKLKLIDSSTKKTLLKRPPTKFAERGEKLHNKICDLVFMKL